MYMFGSKKIFLKLEGGKLAGKLMIIFLFFTLSLVKAGQFQLPIDKFLNLNLESEVDKVGTETKESRYKKSVGK